MASPKPVTYRQLMVALRALRFKRDPKRSAKGYTVLVNSSSDVPIILPVLPPTSPVQATHLAMVRKILRESNPDAEERLNLLLHGHGKPEANGVHAHEPPSVGDVRKPRHRVTK